MRTPRFIPITLTLAGVALASAAFAQYASPSPTPSTGSTTTGTTSQPSPAPGSTGTTGTTTTGTRSTTSMDVRDAEIVAVQGNEVVIKTTDGYRQFMVAPDYRFTINGQPMMITQLKPGMKVTTTIQTTRPYTTLTSTEMRNAEVVSAEGMTVVIKDPSGQQKTFSEREFRGMDLVLYRDGRPVSPSDLRAGDRVTALVFTDGASAATGFSPTTPTSGSASRPYASPSPSGEGSRDVASSQRYGEDDDPSDRGTLPKTASPWPMVGLAGLLLLGIGGAVTLARRFYVG